PDPLVVCGADPADEVAALGRRVSRGCDVCRRCGHGLAAGEALAAGDGLADRCAATQASNSAGVTPRTLNSIWSCWTPQNSAQYPGYGPGVFRRKSNAFVWPGIASRLKRNCGTEKAWITSAASSVMWMGSPTGTTISGCAPGNPTIVTPSSV